jgi:hypothetical protein
MAAKVDTKAAFARLIGKTPQYVNKLVVEKKIPVRPDGKIDREKALSALARNTGARMRSNHNGNGDGTASPGYTDARIRVETAIAQLKELEYRKRLGELLPAVEVQKEWGGLVTAAKNKLRSIPRSIAEVILSAQTPTEAEAILRRAIDEALEELSRG